MKSKQAQLLALLLGSTVAIGVGLGGCAGHRPAAPGPGLTVTDQAITETDADEAQARAEVVAEMRAQAEAAGEHPYPDVFQAERTARLAARQEPRSVQEVAAIQAELALIAEQRAAAGDPREIAALEARAEELKRLFARAQAGEMRR